MATQPSREDVHLRLCPPLSSQQAFALRSAFLHDVIDTFMASPVAARFLCYWPADARDWFNENFAGMDLVQQSGDAPGERLSNAFEQILSIGYSPVIAVRGDMPDLPEEVVAAAVDALRDCDMVVGPTKDGDYYLLALKEPAPELFRRVNWAKTKSVCKHLMAEAAHLGLTVRALDEWDRVDDAAKLKTLARSSTLRPYSRAALKDVGR